MKRLAMLLLVFLLAFSLAGCGSFSWLENNANEKDNSFLATVIEINGNQAVVRPAIAESEYNSSDKISFSFEGKDIDAKVGDTVRITHDGQIMESYPAQIHIEKWEIAPDLKALKFDGVWLDKKGLEKNGETLSRHFRIVEIYADCFFVTADNGERNLLKINGSVGEDICVGDNVDVSYKNIYWNLSGTKGEAELVTVEL